MPQICHNEFLLLIRAKRAEDTSMSTSIDNGPFRTSGHHPSRSIRQGGPKPRTKLQPSPSAMINWHAEDSMKYPGATVDGISEPDVEAAWSAEIERRLIEIDAGMVELIPWDYVRSELFGELEWREEWH